MASKNNYRQVSETERRKITLIILDEVDSFCRANNLKYFISYGTLLGAIRHKGFIPWDDDLDITMPLPDMLKLKKEYKSDLFKFCDVDTEPYYPYPFGRMAYKPTFRIEGKVCETYGVNIDVYPVVGIYDQKGKIEEFFADANKILKKLHKVMRYREATINRLPIKSIPGYSNQCRKLRDYVYNRVPYEQASTFFHMGGPFKWYEVFDYDVFKDLIEVEFEEKRYLAPARYDDYLKQCYGDYMTPPPEEKRHSYHNNVFYWKD